MKFSDLIKYDMKFYELISNIKYRNIHLDPQIFGKFTRVNPQIFGDFTHSWVRDMLYRNINKGE